MQLVNDYREYYKLIEQDLTMLEQAGKYDIERFGFERIIEPEVYDSSQLRHDAITEIESEVMGVARHKQTNVIGYYFWEMDCNGKVRLNCRGLFYRTIASNPITYATARELLIATLSKEENL